VQFYHASEEPHGWLDIAGHKSGAIGSRKTTCPNKMTDQEAATRESGLRMRPAALLCTDSVAEKQTGKNKSNKSSSDHDMTGENKTSLNEIGGGV